MADAEAREAAPEAPDGFTKKLSEMHFCWQSAYFLVCVSVPSPCSHFMAHCVVALTMSSVGLDCVSWWRYNRGGRTGGVGETNAGLPRHSAVQVRLPSHEVTHFCCSDWVIWEAAADEVVVCAAAKAIRPKVMRVLVNFILNVRVVGGGEGKSNECMDGVD